MTTNADPVSAAHRASLAGLWEDSAPERLDDFVTVHERQAPPKTPTVWALTRAYIRALHEVYRKASSARRRKVSPLPAAASRGRRR
jgi:hypothetical protein